jgi:hypothetical protein
LSEEANVISSQQTMAFLRGLAFASLLTSVQLPPAIEGVSFANNNADDENGK